MVLTTINICLKLLNGQKVRIQTMQKGEGGILQENHI